MIALIRTLPKKQSRWRADGWMAKGPVTGVNLWAYQLCRAGDGEWAQRRLLPIYRAGETRVGPRLILNGSIAVLRDATRKLQAWVRKGGQELPESFWVLRQSRERTAVLILIRLALTHADPKQQRMMLRAIRWLAIPSIPPKPTRTTKELREAWQATWRKQAWRFDQRFPPGTVEKLIGKAVGW